MANAATNPWTPERTERLTALWEYTTLSATEIAARLGITKNMVIGKANRLVLTPRARGHKFGVPSPLRVVRLPAPPRATTADERIMRSRPAAQPAKSLPWEPLRQPTLAQLMGGR